MAFSIASSPKDCAFLTDNSQQHTSPMITWNQESSDCRLVRAICFPLFLLPPEELSTPTAGALIRSDNVTTDR